MQYTRICSYKVWVRPNPLKLCYTFKQSFRGFGRTHTLYEQLQRIGFFVRLEKGM